MSRGTRKPVSQLLSILGMAAAAPVMWAAWLGWDQHRDVRPDGTTTGPYEAWQVIGLVLTLLAAVCWAASRRYVAGAVVGTSLGLTAAACYDWSDDSSGLYMVGVGGVMMGSLAVTAVVAAVVSAVIAHGASDGHRTGA
ncbi:hypothetical protein ACWEN3_09630 [Streptomyces sp. NPDC004561]